MPSAAPTLSPTLSSNLQRLGLRRLAEDLNDLIARATRERWGPVPLLEAVVTAEVEDRARRGLERRLKRARLGRFKPLADWEWDWPKSLPRPALERALALDFVGRAEIVILVGAQGLGKTMLAKNLVHEAILAGQQGQDEEHVSHGWPPVSSADELSRFAPHPSIGIRSSSWQYPSDPR